MNFMPALRRGSYRRTLQTKKNSISTLAMAKNKKSRSSWQFEKRLKRKKAFSSPGPAYQEKSGS